MGNCASIMGVFPSKLKRTDADIGLAVNLWVSDKWAAVRKYGSITDWDTSAVTNMKELFRDKEDFNDTTVRKTFHRHPFTQVPA